MVFYERGLKDESTESKFNEFDFDFAQKLKIEERYFFKNINREIIEIKIEIKLNYYSKMKLYTKRR